MVERSRPSGRDVFRDEAVLVHAAGDAFLVRRHARSGWHCTCKEHTETTKQILAEATQQNKTCNKMQRRNTKPTVDGIKFATTVK